ncbi:MAG: FAD binding domain-containing protein [Planctomycetota bacterium]|nr:FAD binding domain-containing protein [Planctomycetota bacterium]
MLRLPAFAYEAPETLEEALDLLATRPGARLIAGGTDLLPNLKHGVEEAEVVVSLCHLPQMTEVVEKDDGSLELGAMVTLENLSEHSAVQHRYPALSQAAGLVAGPHHRRMGTLGGNVCLNTRCVYINQTHFWREALGYCLKKDGEACHVVRKGKRCVAAASNDTAPVLTTLDATLVLASRDRGERTIPIRDFYVQDGVNNKALEPDEMLLKVMVPPPASGLHSAYAKLRPRNSIDFPRLSVAVAFEVADGLVQRAQVVLSALAARPLAVRKLDEITKGREPGEDLWELIAAESHAQAHPLSNIDSDPTYRREMVPVYVRRALRHALKEGASQT